MARDFQVHYQAGLDLRGDHWLYNLDNGYEKTYKSSPAFAIPLAGACIAPANYGPPRLVFARHRVASGRVHRICAPLVSGRFAHFVCQMAGAADICIGVSLFDQSVALWRTDHALDCFGDDRLLCHRARGRPAWSGAALAAGVCVKVLPGCFVPYLLLRRRNWIGLGAFAAGVGLLFAATAACCGWETGVALWRDWPHHLSDPGVWILGNRAEPIGLRSPAPITVPVAVWLRSVQPIARAGCVDLHCVERGSRTWSVPVHLPFAAERPRQLPRRNAFGAIAALHDGVQSARVATQFRRLGFPLLVCLGTDPTVSARPAATGWIACRGPIACLDSGSNAVAAGNGLASFFWLPGLVNRSAGGRRIARLPIGKCCGRAVAAGASAAADAAADFGAAAGCTARAA